MKNTYLLALGSNFNAEKNIASAIEALGKKVEIIQKTRLIETLPLNMPNNFLFLNGLVLIASALTQDNLKIELKSIEKMLGRGEKKGIVPVDIDIIMVNNHVVHKDFELAYIKKLINELNNG